MPQDAFTLKYLCEELNGAFSGAKINKIVQPSNEELIFTLYTGKTTEKLYISVNPACPRIGLCETEKNSPLTVPNFCMLMRKHLLSATIDNISLVGFDRIVKIELTSSSLITEARKKIMYIELMGRYSNVILTENGKVLGGNRGINNFDNGVRPLIVGKPYVFPPQNDKLIPSETALLERLKGYNGEGEYHVFLAENIQGIALSTAKEIVINFEKKFEKISSENAVENAQNIFNFINDFLYKTQKNPCLILENGGVKDVCVYPYSSVCGEVQIYPSLLKAEECYFARREVQSKFKELFNRLSSMVNAHLKKAKKRVQAIDSKMRDAEDAEEERLNGELILANIYKIRQGDGSVTVENYYDRTTKTIPLDINISPSLNAERFYKRYNKKKRTLSALLPQKQKAEEELNYISTVLEEISLCETLEDLKLIREELEEAGIAPIQQKNKKPKSTQLSCRKYEIKGFTLLVGRNNTENDRVTFSAQPTDIWLHAKDYHSSHAIIKANGKEVPEEVIIKSAEVCAYYSKGRAGGKTEIVYTQKKNVKKPKGAKPGFCIYDNFKSVLVMPDKGEEFIKEV